MLQTKTQTLALIFVAALISSRASAITPSIKGLKAIDEKSRTTLYSIDKEMLQVYSEVTKLSPSDALTNRADQKLNAAREKLDRLLDQKHEESLRSELADKLIYKISEKNFNNLKEDLPKAVDELVINELAIGARYTGGDRSSIPFLMNLAAALRTRRESIEDPINFLENYVQYSSILNPKSITQFRTDGGYLNQSESERRAKNTNKKDSEDESETAREDQI